MFAGLVTDFLFESYFLHIKFEFIHKKFLSHNLTTELDHIKYMGTLLLTSYITNFNTIKFYWLSLLQGMYLRTWYDPTILLLGTNLFGY